MKVRQYQIFLVNLDPTKGSEIRKTRPALIISPDEMNASLRTVVIAPLTTTSRHYPTRVKIEQPTIHGFVALDQVRTIDKQRLIKELGSLSRKEIQAVKTVLRQTYVD